MTQLSTHVVLSDNVLSYYDDVFYELVRDNCGPVVEEMFKFQR